MAGRVLDGVRILGLTRLAAGPFATALLESFWSGLLEHQGQRRRDGGIVPSYRPSLPRKLHARTRLIRDDFSP